MKPLDEDFNPTSALKNWLNSPELEQLQKDMEESRNVYEKQCDEYWNGLSYDEQLASFYSVVKRIYQGEVVERATYRYILYDIFGFGPDAYSMGMECGFMSLHNCIEVKD